MREVKIQIGKRNVFPQELSVFVNLVVKLKHACCLNN